MPSDIKECSLYSFTLKGVKTKTTPKDITARALAQEAKELAQSSQGALDATQMAAVNSGVTAAKVAAWDAIEVPTKISDLTNDSGFITAAAIPAVPTKTSDLQNDSGFVTSAAIPDSTSDLNNDSGFITASDIPAVPSKTSELTNDAGFITAEKFGTVTPTIGAASGFGAYVDFPAGFTYTNSVVISIQVAEGTSAYRAGQGVYTTSNMRLFAELSPSGVRMFCNSSHYFGVDCIVALMRIDI